jgi:hypothetical protein
MASTHSTKTWNVHQDQDENDTNMRRFFDLSAEPEARKVYTPRVGMGFGLIEFLGGTFSAGSFSRVEVANRQLKQSWQRGEPVDVIGFSGVCVGARLRQQGGRPLRPAWRAAAGNLAGDCSGNQPDQSL